MLRHSCATFLVLERPEGLGFKMNEFIDYFGHTDTEMLRDIYAKINLEQKSKRMHNTFSEFVIPNSDNMQQENNNTQTRLIEKMKGTHPKAKEMRKERIYRQINKAIEDKRERYYYLKKDEDIINSYISSNPDESKKITFVEDN